MATAIRQHTIGSDARITGIALHTGNRVGLSLHPAPADTGIVFQRIDLPGKPEVRGDLAHVADTRRGTTIRDGDAAVHTVEHLLAALNAFGVDNCRVEMTGPEPPVGDGSSAPFVDMLEKTGVVEQDALRQVLSLQNIVHYQCEESHLIAIPSDCFRITCSVKYGATVLDCQHQSLEITRDNFIRELCQARTFCLYHEIEALIKANLICGGSLDNAVVIKENAILSREGLRYPDEFVRHKMLDIVGDLYLLGHRLNAHIIAIRPGHEANIQLARLIRNGQAPAGRGSGV